MTLRSHREDLTDFPTLPKRNSSPFKPIRSRVHFAPATDWDAAFRHIRRSAARTEHLGDPVPDAC
jgi:hypothetical protein